MLEPAGLRIRVGATANLVAFRIERESSGSGAEIVAVQPFIGSPALLPVGAELLERLGVRINWFPGTGR